MVCPPRFKKFDSRLEWLILDPETLPEIEARQKGVQACDRRSLTGILQCRSLKASWGGGGELLKIAQGRGKMNHMRTSESSWEDQNDKPSPFLASLGHTRWGPEPSLYRVLFSHTWLCNFGWMPSSQSKLRPPNRGLPNLRTSISLKQRLNSEICRFNKAEFLF